MHPSAIYRGGKLKNSLEEEDKYREYMLKKYANSDWDISPSDKKKLDKVKYSRKESEIWE